MKKMLVRMEWSEREKKWLMSKGRKGNFIYDFWDCANVNFLFRGLDKKKANHFMLTVIRGINA